MQGLTTWTDSDLRNSQEDNITNKLAKLCFMSMNDNEKSLSEVEYLLLALPYLQNIVIYFRFIND